MSLLPIVEAVDNFPPFHEAYPTKGPVTPASVEQESYIPFHLSFSDFQAGFEPVGLLRENVWTLIQDDDRDGCFSLYREERPDAEGEATLEAVACFFSEKTAQGGEPAMTAAIAYLTQKWKGEKRFPCLEGWRNELYAVYGPAESSVYAHARGEVTAQYTFKNRAFSMERAAGQLFGVVTYGIHLTVYEGEGENLKLWVGKRSANKPTWPGMLDNTVGGGIPSGMAPFETLVKECDEEASLPEDFVRERVRSTGVMSYFYQTVDGFLQPEVEYVYDLKLPSTDAADYVKPVPHDDEVESFKLMSVPDVLKCLHAGEFKPNCGLIIVNFLIRHGIVTAENEPKLVEITSRCNRRLGLTVAQ